jgi:hypothetical protein
MEMLSLQSSPIELNFFSFSFLELQQNIRHEVIIAIAGNKSDLSERREVPTAKAQEVCSSFLFFSFLFLSFE